MAAAPSSMLPAARVTGTASGTYVFDVHGFSGLQKQYCGSDRFILSPYFTVAGLAWAIRQYHPDGDLDGDSQLHTRPSWSS